jgi:hypothetical protein
MLSAADAKRMAERTYHGQRAAMPAAAAGSARRPSSPSRSRRRRRTGERAGRGGDAVGSLQKCETGHVGTVPAIHRFVANLTSGIAPLPEGEVGHDQAILRPAVRTFVDRRRHQRPVRRGSRLGAAERVAADASPPPQDALLPRGLRQRREQESVVLSQPCQSLNFQGLWSSIIPHCDAIVRKYFNQPGWLIADVGRI